MYIDKNIVYVCMYKVKLKVTQLYLTLCDPMYNTVHGILQARILEWVAFPFPRGSSQPRTEPRSPTLQVDSLPAEPPVCVCVFIFYKYILTYKYIFIFCCYMWFQASTAGLRV